MTSDPYVDPASGVLRNLLGISDPELLASAEADITALAIYRLELRPLPGEYDLDHLCAFHRAIFKDLYGWAGELRTVAIAKGDMFCLPQFLESYGAQVFAELAEEKCLRGLDRERFVERLTYYFGEVNALHPFREGNGRAQRAFWGQLARAAGHPLSWERLDRERNLTASVAIMRGDPQPMFALFSDLVRD